MLIACTVRCARNYDFEYKPRGRIYCQISKSLGMDTAKRRVYTARRESPHITWLTSGKDVRLSIEIPNAVTNLLGFK